MTFLFKHNIAKIHPAYTKAIKKLEKDGLDAIRDGIGNAGVSILSKEAPSSSDAGIHLKDSFFYKLERRNIVSFESKVAYAKMVDRGTRSSVGGYLPVLGRRLKKSTVRKWNIQSDKLKTHPGNRANKYISRAAKRLDRMGLDIVITELEKRGIVRNGELNTS